MSLGPHTVTLLRAPFRSDEYGNEGSDRDWDNAASVTWEGCDVQPTGADEYVIDREAVIVRYRAFCPGSKVVPSPAETVPAGPPDSTDRMEWKGEQYQIDGVESWPDRGSLSHTAFLIRKVRG